MSHTRAMIPQDRLFQIRDRFQYLEAAMSDGSGDIAALAKEYSDLKPVVAQIEDYMGLVEGDMLRANWSTWPELKPSALPTSRMALRVR